MKGISGKRFLLAGGGTAGHVNPLLAVAEALKQHGASVFVLGTREGLESRLVPQAGLPISYIARLPFPRSLNAKALKFPLRFLGQCLQVFRLIGSESIDAVVGFGGYVSAPSYVAARLRRIPLIVHEANALPGFANKLGSRLTKHVAVAFPGTELRGAQLTGLPLRGSIMAALDDVQPWQSRIELGLSPEAPTLLVMGGSLGARSINLATVQAIPTLAAAGIQVFHILGERSELEPESHDGYTAVKYCENMQAAISAADFAVSRAGAATVSEFAAAGLPALYVPYAVGNGEQALNVRDLVQQGGALIQDDSDFGVSSFRDLVIPALSNKKRLAEMSKAAGALGIRNGTERLIGLIEQAMGNLRKP